MQEAACADWLAITLGEGGGGGSGGGACAVARNVNSIAALTRFLLSLLMIYEENL